MKRNQIKVRKTWGTLSPVTRIKESKKLFKRKPKFQKTEDY